MKAVVMAGGSGSRLRPILATPINKHLMPVCGKPLIAHVLMRLAEGGVTQVLVLLNWKHPGLILETVGDGSEYGVEILFRYDKREVGLGVGRDLALAQRWVGDKPFVLMLGDALFFTPLMFVGKTAPHLYVMPIPEVDDPSKYGQVRVNGEHVTALVDKPRERFSSLIQTAAWILPSDAFDRAARLEQDISGEFHIGTLIRNYVETIPTTYTLLPPHSYIDCGTPDAIQWAERQVTLANARQTTRAV